MEDFVAQFGISTDRRLNRKYANSEIGDDPSLPSVRNEMGTLSFATKGVVNSRSSQTFINLEDNYKLDSIGFTPFGFVQDGFGVVQRLYSKYGDYGPNQDILIENGSGFAFNSHPELSRIIYVEYF